MAQKRTAYKNDYNRSHYARISLFTPKETRDIIRKTAEAKGQSLNRYINNAIRDALKRDGVTIEEDVENADIDETE